MNNTEQIPYSSKIRQLNREKSGLLLRAQRLHKDVDKNGEATMLFSKVAEIEMQIAQLLTNFQ